LADSTNSNIADPLQAALNNVVDEFVQIELQRRQFGNRYTKKQAPNEPINDFQSISIEDYQIYKPAWAVIRELNKTSIEATLLGTALSFIPGGEKGKKFGKPEKGKYFDRQYESVNPSGEYISEYGTGGSYRPKPGMRNLSVSYDGSGLYSTITMNIKAYTKYQLNKLSNSYLEIGKECLIMFGYSDPANSNVIHSIVNLKNPYNEEKGLFAGGKDSLESMAALYSLGKVYAKVARVQGFDINVTPEDGSFDINLTLVTEGALSEYNAEQDNASGRAMYEMLNKVPIATQESKASEEDEKYMLFRDFLLKLRDYPDTELSKAYQGGSFFTLPTRDTLLTIGQERTFEYYEIAMYERGKDQEDGTGTGTTEDPIIVSEERNYGSGSAEFSTRVDANTAERMSLLYEGVESDKSLHTTDTAFKGLWPNPEGNIPDSMTQLVVSVRPNTDSGKASKNGNKEARQMYIPWAVCEWIINNGVSHVNAKKEEKVILSRFSCPLPKMTIYHIPMIPTTVTEKIEYPPDETAPSETAKKKNPPEGHAQHRPTHKTTTTYTDDMANMTSDVPGSEVPATHKSGTFIRSVIFPTFTDGISRKNMGLIKDYPPKEKNSESGEVEEATLEVKNKFTSTSVDAHSGELFSNNPGICVLSKTNGLVSPRNVIEGEKTIESKEFRMFDLVDEFSSFKDEEKKNIYIRNILINADYFFKKYTTAKAVETEKGLKEFVDEIFVDVSSCFNNTVQFSTHVDDDGAVRVIDKTLSQTVYSKIELETANLDYRELKSTHTTSGNTYRLYNQVFPLNTFGQDSIVREINYSMDLDSDIANHFFFNNTTESQSTDTNTLLKLSKLKKQRNTLLDSGEDITKLDEDYDVLVEKLDDEQAKAGTYLDQYLDSATRTYGKLIPKKNSYVDFSSQTNILKTKLTKILTSADVVNAKKEIKPPSRTPKLPFQVEITLDGISGIKMYDAFHLTYVPALYSSGHFKVVAITHSLDGTDWLTKLTLLYVEATEMKAKDPKKT
jgi:hypothetical protein